MEIIIREKRVLIDKVYYNEFIKYNWRINENHYVVRREGLSIFLLNVEVMKFYGLYIKKMDVHHKNWNPLDNRLENLEVMTRQQNCWLRRKRIDGKTNFVGVSPFKGRFQCEIRDINKKRVWIGVFGTDIEAAIAYDLYAIGYRERYCIPNILNHDLSIKEKYKETARKIIKRYQYDLKDKFGIEYVRILEEL